MSFKSGKESYDSFGSFGSVGFYNAVKEGDSIVCFVTDKSKTANCADLVLEVSSSPVSSSAESSSSKMNESSSSSKDVQEKSSSSKDEESSSSAKKISINDESDVVVNTLKNLAEIRVSSGMLYVGMPVEGSKKLEIIDVLGHRVKSFEFTSEFMNIPLSEISSAKTLILRLFVVFPEFKKSPYKI